MFQETKPFTLIHDIHLRRKLNQLFSIVISALILCLVACYNTYPLTFNNDTGMYINSGFSGRVANDRPILYGLFIFFFSLQQSLWLVIFVQSLMVSTILFYYFKYFTCNINYIPYFIAFVGLISLCMAASFEVSWLMPDVFTSILILCLGLLIFKNDIIIRDLIVVSFLLILSIGVHNSHFFIYIGLCIIVFAGFLIKKTRKAHDNLNLNFKRLAFIISLGISSYFITGGIHYFYGGTFKSSRGGAIFLMSNLVEMGILDSYLNDNCAKHNFTLCAYRDSIPNNFLWEENSPIYKTGGWARNEKEYSTIIYNILTTPKYLKTFIFKSMVYTVKQFFNYDVIDINKPSDVINEAIMGNFNQEYNNFLRARQNNDKISFGLINFTQNIIVGICLFLYITILVLNKTTTEFKLLLIFILIALFLNAWVCSTFSGVFSRYQSRVTWLLPLPLFLHAMSSPAFYFIFNRKVLLKKND